MTTRFVQSLLLAAGLMLAGSALATLPKPTPAQAEAAAAKKADADAKAAKEKEALLATMDKVSDRWKSRAASEGWKIKPPVVAPGSVSINAAPGVETVAAGGPPVPGATPLSPHALNAANLPVKTEKAGTAIASEDVKKKPSTSLPRGAAPVTSKKDSPETANMK
jgi:hypothetical protein